MYRVIDLCDFFVLESAEVCFFIFFNTPKLMTEIGKSMQNYLLAQRMADSITMKS
jgi:hypothetical protein